MAKLVTQYENDPFVGHLSTPITTSLLTRLILSNLPAYRQGLSCTLRGIEIGLAHGYLLFGPFATFGPLRNSEIANFAGLLSTLGLLTILGIALAIYGNVSFDKSSKDSDLLSKDGWRKFTLGFIVGSFGAATFAFGLANNIHTVF
jgi:photosystem I subunit 11